MPFFFDYRLYSYRLLFTYRTGYDVYNCVMVAPGFSEDPAYIRDPASIRTTDSDPRLVLETRLLFETRLLLEVLRYSYFFVTVT